MAGKSKKFKLQTKDGKQVFEIDSAIEANRYRAQGLVDVPKAPVRNDSSSSGSGSKSDKK